MAKPSQDSLPPTWSNDEKIAILKKVLTRTRHVHEEMIQHEERGEMDQLLDNFTHNHVPGTTE